MALHRTSNSFHWLDYLVLTLSLLASCSVGVYFALSGGRQRTTAEYLMGDRSLSIVPVSLSVVASFLSAIMILGQPAEIYLNGIGFQFNLVGVIVVYLLSAGLFLNLLYPLRLTSVYEFLDRRFQSKLVRCIGNGLSLLIMTIYAGMATFAPCTATEQVTNNAFRREYVIAACSVIGTFYTMIGGLKAVVWVDTIQASIMFFGTLAVAIKALMDSGGWLTMWQLNTEYGRLEWPSFSPDPRVRHSMWGLTVGQAFYWTSSIGISQTAVQRYNALPSLRAAKLCLLVAMPAHVLMGSLCTLVGMAIFGSYAYAACDIFRAGWVDSNQIVTYYVMDRMHVPGFPGLFTAALFAAALSSVSSALNSASTIAWTDLLQPYFFKGISESKAALVAKALVAVFGTLSTLIAYTVSQLGGTIIQATMTFLGAAIGPSLGQFLLACLFPSANWFGATVGPFAGLACSLWIGVGAYSARKQHVTLPGNVTGCGLAFSNLTSAMATTAATNGSSITGAALLVTNGTFAAAGAAPSGFLVEYIYSISYVWTAFTGAFITVLVGLLCSWIAERGRFFGFVDPIDVDARYLLPGARQIWRAIGGCGRVRIVENTFVVEADGQESTPVDTTEIPTQEKSAIDSEDAASRGTAIGAAGVTMTQL